jgi:hypothetical protein
MNNDAKCEMCVVWAYPPPFTLKTQNKTTTNTNSHQDRKQITKTNNK